MFNRCLKTRAEALWLLTRSIDAKVGQDIVIVNTFNRCLGYSNIVVVNLFNRCLKTRTEALWLLTRSIDAKVGQDIVIVNMFNRCLGYSNIVVVNLFNRCLMRDDIMRSRRENNIWRHIVMIEASMEAFNFQFRSHTCMEAFSWSINSSNTYTIMEAFNCDWTWRHNTMMASSIDQIKKGKWCGTKMEVYK